MGEGGQGQGVEEEREVKGKEKRRQSPKIFPSSPPCQCAAHHGGNGMGWCPGSREVEMGRNGVQSTDVAEREGHLTERNGKRERERNTEGRKYLKSKKGESKR